MAAPTIMQLLLPALVLIVPVESVLNSYANRRSFLLVHGSGSSASAFPNSPTASGAKNFLSGVPRRPDQGGMAGIIPLNWQYYAVDAGSTDGSWWQGDDYSGMAAAIAEVEAAIEEKQGAITGIVGHGQGGLVAACVAARAALGEGPLCTASAKSLSPSALKFAIVCGAQMPQSGPYVDLLMRLQQSRDATIQSLHCMSQADDASELSQELASCFPSAELLWHDRGVAMPDKSWWKETRAFPDRCLGKMRYVDQYTVARTDTPTTFTTPTNSHTPTALPVPTELPTPTVS